MAWLEQGQHIVAGLSLGALGAGRWAPARLHCLWAGRGGAGRVEVRRHPGLRWPQGFGLLSVMHDARRTTHDMYACTSPRVQGMAGVRPMHG